MKNYFSSELWKNKLGWGPNLVNGDKKDIQTGLSSHSQQRHICSVIFLCITFILFCFLGKKFYTVPFKYQKHVLPVYSAWSNKVWLFGSSKGPMSDLHIYIDLLEYWFRGKSLICAERHFSSYRWSNFQPSSSMTQGIGICASVHSPSPLHYVPVTSS